MMSKSNVVGAALASFGFFVVIFAGTLGQFFTQTDGLVKETIYDLPPVPLEASMGYAESVTYDEQGEIMDYTKIPGIVAESPSTEEGMCPSKTYRYELQEVKAWKKGSVAATVEKSLSEEVQPFLRACAVPEGRGFECADECESVTEDTVVTEKPFSLTLQAADAAGPGILQYVYVLNGACLRVKNCSVKAP